MWLIRELTLAEVKCCPAQDDGGMRLFFPLQASSTLRLPAESSDDTGQERFPDLQAAGVGHSRVQTTTTLFFGRVICGGALSLVKSDATGRVGYDAGLGLNPGDRDGRRGKQEWGPQKWARQKLLWDANLRRGPMWGPLSHSRHHRERESTTHYRGQQKRRFPSHHIGTTLAAFCHLWSVTPSMCI